MKVLFPASEITRRVQELGKRIASEYQGKDLLVIAILKGGFMFASDLVRSVDLPLKIEFVRLSSYGCSDSPQGEVKILSDLDCPIAGRHVLIVDDIMDTGHSLIAFKKHLESRKPASVRICTMIDKTCRRGKPIEPDYYGFRIEDGFVVGYGLDYAEDFRTLPDIYIFEPADSQR
ncbi:MAG TPA: hypoxanthine phosphoribosyltransferase [Deltaproteobacteria bacterium]|jgi:hypoxanthine phosphoribosyltransferase|nr:hypoxanthine phosphoribosyltransferase [Deltaproteobacteria bacterium]HOI07736.1 hypoxanthine phosphoribosyltransferase [Deltaproteobacteria bacterium]